MRAYWEAEALFVFTSQKPDLVTRLCKLQETQICSPSAHLPILQLRPVVYCCSSRFIDYYFTAQGLLPVSESP